MLAMRPGTSQATRDTVTPFDGLRGRAAAQVVGSRAPVLKGGNGRKVFPMDRKKSASESSLDQMLAAALQSRDREVSGVLLEMGEISKILESSAPDSQILAAAVQRAVAGAVKQCLLERELRSLALTDDLTGLYNRRAFLTLASQQMKLSRRKGKSLLLFFADVDGLKRINDEFGHQAGDLAIARTAEALERSFRKSDIVARIGGDEFVALAFEASGQ